MVESLMLSSLNKPQENAAVNEPPFRYSNTSMSLLQLKSKAKINSEVQIQKSQILPKLLALSSINKPQRKGLCERAHAHLCDDNNYSFSKPIQLTKFEWSRSEEITLYLKKFQTKFYALSLSFDIYSKVWVSMKKKT